MRPAPPPMSWEIDRRRANSPDRRRSFQADSLLVFFIVGAGFGFSHASLKSIPASKQWSHLNVSYMYGSMLADGSNAATTSRLVSLLPCSRLPLMPVLICRNHHCRDEMTGGYGQYFVRHVGGRREELVRRFNHGVEGEHG